MNANWPMYSSALGNVDDEDDDTDEDDDDTDVDVERVWREVQLENAYLPMLVMR